jgi:hypothetical protein
MKITRRKLRLLVEKAIFEAKNSFKQVKGGREKAVKVAKYGNPKERSDLKDF